MSQPELSQAWTVQQALMRLSNPWLSLIGERLRTPQGQELDYWRIERADSAIVVPIWRQNLVLPPATFRPGDREVTLDFPGGRIPANQNPLEAAHQILQRELAIEAGKIMDISPLNQVGWPVNSSLSNQRLYGFYAYLNREINFLAQPDYPCYPLNQEGIAQLLEVLSCLQCRGVLLSLQLTLNL